MIVKLQHSELELISVCRLLLDQPRLLEVLPDCICLAPPGRSKLHDWQIEAEEAAVLFKTKLTRWKRTEIHRAGGGSRNASETRARWKISQKVSKSGGSDSESGAGGCRVFLREELRRGGSAAHLARKAASLHRLESTCSGFNVPLHLSPPTLRSSRQFVMTTC